MTVTTTGDSGGGCSLRAAITAVNTSNSSTACGAVASSGPTTISVPAGTYTLTGGELQIAAGANVDIVGSGASSSGTVIDAGHASRVFEIAQNGQAALSALEVTGGQTAAGADGASAGQYGSSADGGGGILNHGSLTLTGTLVTGNGTGHGGRGADGVYNGGTAIGARQGGSGGSGAGVYSDTGSTLSVQSSTITANLTGDGGTGGNGARGVQGNGNIPGGEDGAPGGYPGSGGGIYNAGSATITNSTISANHTGRGGHGGDGGDGAAGAAGSSAGTGGNAGPGEGGGVTYSYTTGNPTYEGYVGGGGIYNGGTLNLSASTISANGTGAGGVGGVAGNGGQNSNNSYQDSGKGGDAGSGGLGGGLLDYGSGATLTNATIAGNSTGDGATGGGAAQSGGNIQGGNGGFGGYGGGIFSQGGDHVALTQVTISQNSLGAAGAAGLNRIAGERGVGGGITGGGFIEKNTIIAANGSSAAGDKQCANTSGISDGGDNLSFPDNACPGANADPKLGALTDNGGSTDTMLPGSGSAAIGAVAPSACTVNVDQRGDPRPGSGKTNCDIGAVETAASGLATTTTTVTSSANPSTPGQTVTFTASVTPIPDGGHVSFTDGGVAIPGCSSATLDAGGKATCQQTYSSAGTHSIVASYAGDGSFAASASSTLTQIARPPSGGGGGGGGGGSGNPSYGQASISHPKLKGTTVNVPLGCIGPSGASCVTTLTLSATETFKGSQLISAGHSAKSKRHKRTVTLGQLTVTITAGSTRQVQLSLNAKGKRLLKKAHKLKATLSAIQHDGSSQATVFTQKVTFKAKRHR